VGCGEAERALSALIDRELETPVQATVREHVDRCPACRNKLLLLEATRKLVGSLEAEEVGPGFDAALAHRLRQARASDRRRRAVLAWASVAAAVALVVAPRLVRRDEKQPVATPRIAERAGGSRVPAPSPLEGEAQGPELGPREPSPPRRSRSAGGTPTTAPLPTAPSVDPVGDDGGELEPIGPGPSPGLPHAEPIRIALPGPADEAWRGGRSADLAAFEERVAAEARRAVMVTEFRREE
jgi:anti-sigma factor RsiW